MLPGPWRTLLWVFLCAWLSAGLLHCAEKDDDDPSYDAPPLSDDDDDQTGSPGSLISKTDSAFPVGNRTFLFIDHSRWDPITQSARRVLTEVWYPAGEASKDLPRDILRNFFGDWDEEVLAMLAEDGAPEDELAHFDRETGSARDAPMNRDHAPYPVVLFSHGITGVRFHTYRLCEALASLGFIVVAPEHTGSSAATPLPNQLVLFDEEMIPLSYFQRIYDLIFLMDTLTELNEYDPGRFFTGAIDPERIGAMGHSFGGTSVLETAKLDLRIRAAVSFASVMIPWLDEDFDTPLFFMLGREDTTMHRFLPLMGYEYEIAPPPKFNLEFFDGGHSTFTEACNLVPTVLGEGNGCGAGARRETGEPFDFIPYDQAFPVIRDYVTAFFEFTLREDDKSREYLEVNRYPEKIDYQAALE